jgi:hypothetical protein
MQVIIEIPTAFSVRDDRELPLIQDLMARLNPDLSVAQVATGVHVSGGSTVNWGLVHLKDQPLVGSEVRAALEKAGLDFQHNGEIQAPRIWIEDQSDVIETTPNIL